MAYAMELRYYINVNFNWNRGFPRSLEEPTPPIEPEPLKRRQVEQ